ncbi:MAG: hypothetical protein IPL61_34695 [Myxococcales bacterium]|nr:hypothetical protein [Myxococcales bacterium]
MKGVIVVAALLAATPASGAPPGSDGLGFVPGIRVGAVKGSVDGVNGLPGGSGWGSTYELHADLLKTYGHDRYALGAAVGYLSQSKMDRDPNTFVLAPDAFDHSGFTLTGFAAAAIAPRNSVSLRLGVVSGATDTASGRIDAGLYRVGGQLTHVFTVSLFDLALALGVEYFTSSDDAGRGYHATALTVDLTGALAF